jgi:hypothetical protein
MFGGLESTQKLLGSDNISDEKTKQKRSFWALQIGETSCSDDSNSLRTVCVEISTSAIGDCDSSLSSLFGMACCTMLSRHLLVVTGGVQSGGLHSTSIPPPPVQAFWMYSRYSQKDALCIERVPFYFDQQSTFDFSSLIHHCCLPVSHDTILLVGGGVSSFAFGEHYARSFHLRIDTELNERDDTIKSGMLVENQKIFDSKIWNGAIINPKLPSNAEITNVVYVEPQNAKRMKNHLQEMGWLEKKYRMIKCTSTASNDGGSKHLVKIAIPISNNCDLTALLADDFCKSLIISDGQMEMPFSTSQYAAAAAAGGNSKKLKG